MRQAPYEEMTGPLKGESRPVVALPAWDPLVPRHGDFCFTWSQALSVGIKPHIQSTSTPTGSLSVIYTGYIITSLVEEAFKSAYGGAVQLQSPLHDLAKQFV